MTRERFEELAQAFGGSIARWPAAERDAAAVLMTAEPDFARRVLGEAQALDAALDAWPPLTVSRALSEAVIRPAARAPAHLGARRWLWGAGAGAGLAAACAAGLLMGVALYGQTSSADEPIGAVMASYDLPAGLEGAGGPT